MLESYLPFIVNSCVERKRETPTGKRDSQDPTGVKNERRGGLTLARGKRVLERKATTILQNRNKCFAI